MLLLGVDTGGTFTDFVLQTDNGLQTYKLPSTPDDPSRAILQGLDHFFGPSLPEDLEIIHGSTVATNAFLERKGAKTLLVTTNGFEDILFIGRQNRSRLYDFNIERPVAIITRDQVVGVRERMLADGSVLKALGKTVCKRLRTLCREKGIESIAVCLLHSYANDIHEKKIGSGLARTTIPVTLSAEILPEFREYERMTTTLVNAYLGPIIDSYINRLKHKLQDTPLHIQQSNGGILPAEDIEKRAVYTVLSGPAGGVHGAHQLGLEMGLERLITFDMGGTSTDVSLCDSKPTLTRDYEIDGYPIRIEMLDIHTVGAGGGSIAHIDTGGLLKVGPQSAGARPGPICYGVGGRELTVTDANLYLGRLLPEKFMGGTMQLQEKEVAAAMNQLAKTLGLKPAAAAQGIIRIVNASMAKAIRRVSLEKGYDPKEFSLFAFGGASGLHCCELAMELGINRIVIPARAGILSAQGMVFAEPTIDYLQSLFLRDNELDTSILSERMESLFARGIADAQSLNRNSTRDRIRVSGFLNLRYRGQSYELSIPYRKNFKELFHRAHEQNFGYRLEDVPLELVSIQCVVKIKRDMQPLPRLAKKTGKKVEPAGEQVVHFDRSPSLAPVYDRAGMSPGACLSGPALIVDNYTTILLPAGFSLEVDEFLNIVLRQES